MRVKAFSYLLQQYEQEDKREKAPTSSVPFSPMDLHSDGKSGGPAQNVGHPAVEGTQNKTPAVRGGGGWDVIKNTPTKIHFFSKETNTGFFCFIFCFLFCK